MKAVVMAGGEGSRLRPLTSNRPKPLVPIGNRPIMEHILYLLKHHQVTDIVSTLYYLSDEIQSYFGDGSDFGVSMTYSIETRPLGTAGSVKLAEDQLRDETFIIISGDALTDCDLTAAVEFHRAKGSLATLVLARVPNPLDFGVVITDEESRITRFLEKPGWSEVFSDTVNTGIYILEPTVFDMMDPNRSYDWSSDIFPKILESGQPIFGYVMDGYWADVGSLTQYREANEDYLQHKVKLPSVAPSDEQHNEYGPNVSIDDRATIIAPVALGRNVKIKRGAQIGPYTVIGDNTVVEEDALIERSVLWDSVYVGPNVAIHSAMLGSRSIIKKDSVIREDAVIGDRCLIDVGGNIRPRIKIWPDKIVERGSTVTMSLVWGNKWRGNLFRDLGVAGLSNIEITPDFACRLGSAFGSCFNPGSRIVTSRDSTRSSRMIKRAIIASLLSVGLDVLDMRSAALPVARHFIRASGAVGAVNVRKLPGNSRVTLIEMFDSEGAYLSRSLERKVESLFYREDFKRTDPDDLGTMEFASRAVEEYQNDFFRALGEGTALRRMRIVCDYGYSSLASIFPAMLERLGVESISINSFNDAKLAPRSDADVERHVQNLRHIVGTLSYDMGVLFTEEGERLVLVDGHGEHIEGPRLLGVVGTLVAMTSPGAEVAMSVSAPTSLEESLVAHGAKVIRTKDDVRSLMASSLERRVAFAGDQRGGFIFPDLHPGFDAPFALGRLISMLQKTGLSLTEVAAALPAFNMAYEQVKVPWEHKGLVMRRLTEEVGRGSHVELLDGIKVFTDHSWVLVLPDSLEPTFHLYAESDSQSHSNALINEYTVKIQAILPEASRNG